MGLVVSPAFIIQHFSIVMFLIIQLLVFKLLVNAVVIKISARVSLITAARAAMMLSGISELSLVLVNRAESVGLVTREVYLQILSSAVIAMVSRVGVEVVSDLRKSLPLTYFSLSSLSSLVSRLSHLSLSLSLSLSLLLLPTLLLVSPSRSLSRSSSKSLATR